MEIINQEYALFDGNITLNNLVLVNGFADNGGAIFINKTVTCNNVVFENNYAKKGGAIYTNSNITLDNCIFNGGGMLNMVLQYMPTHLHRKNMKCMAL